MPPLRTLTDLFFDAHARFGDRPVAMRIKRDGRWVEISYREMREQVEAASIGMLEVGVRPGDRIAILSDNRPEWSIADYACLAARCADVPIYPTLPPKQIAYILNDSGAVAICVSTPAQLAKILEIRATVPALRYVVAFDAAATAAGVLSFDALLARGRAARSTHPTWQENALAAAPDELATVLYTSGTTGDPKGVMLTHGNITSNVVAALTVLPLTDGDECVSFLPLSHIFERMAGHYCMLSAGAVINYAQGIDTVAADMQERHPTVVISVPRLYEKIYSRVLQSVASGSAVKRRIFVWARRNGEQWAEYVLAHRPVPRGLAVRRALADRLVFAKLRQRTGGAIRFFASGGAPLSPDIAKFFFAAGLPILEGYGLTETSPIICVNSLAHLKIGTVGRPLPGVEVRIAPDGEILTRGPQVMRGYYRNPEATAETIDADGWLRTGDIGVIDRDGFLRITDRKKDIIVTAGGKNIAPQPIENLARASKFVANAVMLGDKRRFPILLVVPNMETLRIWAGERNLPTDDTRALLHLPETQAMVERDVRKQLRDLAHFEVPKKMLLLADDFTIESGELTPTLKVKRRVVEQHYRAQIEALYEESSAPIRTTGSR